MLKWIDNTGEEPPHKLAIVEMKAGGYYLSTHMGSVMWELDTFNPIVKYMIIED